MFAATLTDNVTDDINDISENIRTTSKSPADKSPLPQVVDSVPEQYHNKHLEHQPSDLEPNSKSSPSMTDAEKKEKLLQLETQHQAWCAAVEAKVSMDVNMIRSQLGTEEISEETARELYLQADGDPIEAIAMHLNPAYAEKTKKNIQQTRELRAEYAHDLQTCNMNVDPQTAIRRLRAMSNSKDRVLIEVLDKQKQQQKQQQNQPQNQPQNQQ